MWFGASPHHVAGGCHAHPPCTPLSDPLGGVGRCFLPLPGSSFVGSPCGWRTLGRCGLHRVIYAVADDKRAGLRRAIRAVRAPTGQSPSWRCPPPARRASRKLNREDACARRPCGWRTLGRCGPHRAICAVAVPTGQSPSGRCAPRRASRKLNRGDACARRPCGRRTLGCCGPHRVISAVAVPAGQSPSGCCAPPARRANWKQKRGYAGARRPCGRRTPRRRGLNKRASMDGYERS